MNATQMGMDTHPVAVGNNAVRDLFRELADLAPEERERILAKRVLPTGIRAELEALLRYDASSSASLTRRVSDAAEDVVRWGSGPASRYCGPYHLTGLLGAGGMGAVYLAERDDGELEQKVAVKLLRADADRPAWRERFLRERQLLAYLHHSSIARLLDAGHTDDGRPYLVMEYVDGKPIDEYAARLDLRAKLNLFLLVCDGVAHAHEHSIIHRDLKPSNILVDSSGQPKLLDFGIAKLLDAADQTRTMERLFTPNYASPEQLRGEPQTFATDVFSLGAVLHKLATGHSPREMASQGSQAALSAAASAGTLPEPKLPPDLDHIVRKAMREEPDERYPSVSALVSDIRAFLESRPVQARSAHTWYRTRKFLHRHTVATAAAIVAGAGLLLAVNVLERQRGIAQNRTRQVRQLVSSVLSSGDLGKDIQGPTGSMRHIVAISEKHVDALAADANSDQSLALEVGEAYSLLARAKGITRAASSAQQGEAEASLRKAEYFVDRVLRTAPQQREALLTAARISHDRMILAENVRLSQEARAHALQAVAYLDKLLTLGPLSPSESETVSELFYNAALTHKNLHLPEEGILYAKRSIEASRTSPNAPLRLSIALSMLADLLRFRGDLDGALAAIREARVNISGAHFASDTERRFAWCRVLGREAKILAVPGGISLNRPAEALPLVQQSFDMLDQWAESDRESAWSRLTLATTGRQLGDTLLLRDPHKALSVYDHTLRHLHEVADNVEARRAEAEILAGSSYALRRLGKPDEAKARLETAFQLLAESGDYPAEQVLPLEAAEAALRALGDHLAETGQPQRAAEVYQELLERIMRSQPDLNNDLGHAVALSRIYAPLAALHLRNGQRDRSQAVSALRLELWLHWDRKLPGNPFVRRQLESANKQAPSRIHPFYLAS